MSGFTLKIIALLLMTADHLSIIFGSLPYLRIPGRLSAPIFAFILSEGVRYTSDRKKYMFRLYVFAVLMATCNMLTGYEVQNNIMATFFLTVLNITAIENVLNKKYIWLLAFAFQITAVFAGTEFLRILMPSPSTCEGGIMWVALGMALYFLRESKAARLAAIAVFAIMQFSPQAEGVAEAYQWMMIFAIPIIAMYNGKRGKGVKYLFYIYYPLHIYLFWFISKSI